MHVAAPAVAHEFLADVGDDAEIGKARIEGVPQIVKPEARNLRPANCTGPSGFDSADWCVLERKDDSGFLAHSFEHRQESGGHWNEPVLPFGGF